MSTDLENHAPEAVVQNKKSFSIVWLVPTVALLIGVWLVYVFLSEKGPTITITFENAEGLEAGKTKIKYKNVDIGQVESISLSPDLSHVVVTAEMVKGAKAYLSENTRFWVVRARLAAGEVSGLGTLFSGAYIGVDPGKKGEYLKKFKGLEIPPVVSADLPGRHFILKSKRLGSLDIGSPVYYRQIKVGRVVGYALEKGGTAVTIKIFIHAPHHERVKKNSRFWIAAGFNVSLDANGIKVNTESLATILIGGVSFETPVSLEQGDPAEENQLFRLFESYDEITEFQYVRKAYYILHFNNSVRGLSVAAPVEFRGIKVGQVTDINLEFDKNKLAFRIPVLIEIEPDRVKMIGETSLEREDIMERLVERGLRAQLKTGSILTGQLFVDLDFHPDAAKAAVLRAGRYPELPTVPAPLEEITASVSRIIKKLDQLPIQEIGADLRDTVQGAKKLTTSVHLHEAIENLNKTLAHTQALAAKLDRQIAPEFSTTLKTAQEALTAAERLLKSDSSFRHEMGKALKEVSVAARAIRDLADYLERHPEALLYGKGQK